MARRRRKSRGRKLILAVAALCLAAVYPLQEQLTDGGGDSRGAGNAAAEDVSAAASDVFRDGSTLEVHFLDVGQGDATLIRCGEAAMLIDAGNNSWGDDVRDYLEYQGIGDLDYVIGTHPDADHIGGLDVVMEAFDCGTVIMPDYEKDTQTYTDVTDVMEEKGYELTLPQVGTVYELGEAAFTIVAPNGEYGDNANDYSVGILLEHGENRFLLTGDAEEDSEADMLDNGIDLSADVLKAAHHGSRTANTEAFLERVNPEYVVISCGEGNSYGHPHAEVLNRLREMGIKVFRTDEEGTVVATSDGAGITFNVPPSESWQAGEPKG
ncbi:MAG: ComEC/Rec2 family competence protein [Candidatus Merdisoma sp.]|jgi:competence protein ComEC